MITFMSFKINILLYIFTGFFIISYNQLNRKKEYN